MTTERTVTLLDLYAAIYAAELLDNPSQEIMGAIAELKAKPLLITRTEQGHPRDWEVVNYCVQCYGQMGQVPDVNIEAYDKLVALLRTLS